MSVAAITFRYSYTPTPPTQLLQLQQQHHHHHHHHHRFLLRLRCSDSSKPPPRGFNGKKAPTSKVNKGMLLPQQRKLTSTQSGPIPGQAPGLSLKLEKNYNKIPSDLQFEERLEAVKRSALEQKRGEEEREFGAIDYDAPVASKQSTIGLGTKIGVGVAVVVFGLVFAFGDFLPTGSISSNEDDGAVINKLSQEERATLQDRLQQYEAILSSSPRDPVALEGAAVTLAQLGEYTQAATCLQELTEEKSSDPDVFRLLGEVKYELKDYDASAVAYKTSAKVSNTLNFEVLRGLTNALLAAKKPDEAVQVLLESREQLNMGQLSESTKKTQGSSTENGPDNVDPVQVELLLGKAYSDWGHISDAVSVYDQLISSHPNDFRGYLAKGILLKENGNVGDAERMFIQARFFAPEKAKALVDRYSRK